MTITLDEMIHANPLLNDKIINSIVVLLSTSNRKIKKDELRKSIIFVSKHNLWKNVQTEFIFFKNSLDNACFFGNNALIKKFVNNLDKVVTGVEHEGLPFNYKKNIEILNQEFDTYSLVWIGKKESILKTLTPIAKICRPLQ